MQDIVSINFLDTQENKEYVELIEKVIDKCFEEEKLKGLNIYISITLKTPKKIRELNKEYRNIDKETDVLSFPMFEKNEIDAIVEKREEMPVAEVLGDVVISLE